GVRAGARIHLALAESGVDLDATAHPRTGALHGRNLSIGLREPASHRRLGLDAAHDRAELEIQTSRDPAPAHAVPLERAQLLDGDVGLRIRGDRMGNRELAP